MGFRKWVARAPALEGLRHAARWVLGRGFMHAAHMFGARKNRVLFSSFRGKGYSDSPRAISEALRALCPNAEIIWQFREGAGEGAPAYVRRVRYRSLGALCKIATARVLVDNFNRPHFMPKYADQVYVQTWHGDRAFKKVMFDAFPNEPFPDGAQMDLAVAGSDYGERQFRSAFRYAGDVLKAGLP
jgi:CDP-glycerol glycerophosphotransferase